MSRFFRSLVRRRRARSAETLHGQRGIISVEFALTFPLLLIVFFATASIGHFVYLRHRLTHSVMQTARACSLAQLDAEECRLALLARTQSITSWCDGAPGIVPNTQAEILGQPALELLFSCSYKAGVLGSVLKENGVPKLSLLEASVLVPYPVSTDKE